MIRTAKKSNRAVGSGKRASLNWNLDERSCQQLRGLERKGGVHSKKVSKEEWVMHQLSGEQKAPVSPGNNAAEGQHAVKGTTHVPSDLCLFNPLVPFQLSLTWCNWPRETVFSGPLDITPSSLEFILDFLPSHSAFNPSAVWSILSPNKSLFHSLFCHFAYYQLALSHQISLPGLLQQSLN